MAIGKKEWIIPDCELPQEGEGVAKGHESVIIVNDSDVDAKIKNHIRVLCGKLMQNVLSALE